MFRFAFCALLLLPASSAYADAATQTDWSGGPGVPGPVLSWGDDFSIDTGTSWYKIVGLVEIAEYPPLKHTIDGSFDTAEVAYSGDINGDGRTDVLGGAWTAGIVWWENADGAGTVWIEHVIDSAYDGCHDAICSDIDGDGDLDAIGTSYSRDEVAWWENADGAGTSWIQHVVDGSFDGSVCVRSDDVDGDGDLDLLGAAFFSDEITWWDNVDGLGTSWVRNVVGSALGASGVSTSDLDGDGDVDVLGVAFTADSIIWWENSDGIGTIWIPRLVDGNFEGANFVCSADIDGDGDSDVLGAATTADDVAWWENSNGAGTIWVEHIIDASFDGAISLSTDDLDGDGEIDVVGSARFADEIAWWQNTNGMGTGWEKHVVVKDYNYPDCTISSDIDGDGHIDVIGTSRIDDDVTWWDLISYPGSASLESSILNVDCDPDWGTLLWSSQTPPCTAVAFQVRASDDYTQMGAWSDTLITPFSLHGILADNASYVQYRAILTTADPNTTPTLIDVMVTWNPLGTGETESPTTIELQPFSPNPRSGPVVVSFGLPSATVANFSVFDLSGRVVAQAPATEYSAGYQQIQLGELPPGIYICSMRAGSFSATQRFAIVE